MSVHNFVEKIFNVDQLKNLKIQNLELQEAFDNKIQNLLYSPDSAELLERCSLNINKLLLYLRDHSREQQRKLAQSSILELNTNIKNEIYTSINMYETLINKITDCNSISKIELKK